jgi:hypothetical protein
VVIGGKVVSAAGVTAGFDGVLRVAALLCGERKAQEIQLHIQYAPEPPFNSGSVNMAARQVAQTVRAAYQSVTHAWLRRGVLDQPSVRPRKIAPQESREIIFQPALESFLV